MVITLSIILDNDHKKGAEKSIDVPVTKLLYQKDLN